MSRKKLSKSDIYFIEKNPENMTEDELADLLKTDVETIRSHQKSRPHIHQIQSKVRDKMVKKSAMGRHDVSIMTPGASAEVDDARSKGILKSKKFIDCITKMIDE